MAANQQCVGRFEFNLPDTLASIARTQSIYRMDLTSQPLAADAAQTLWERRLTRIRSLPHPPRVPETIRKTLDLNPGIVGVWYYADPYRPETITLEAMKEVGGHVVVITGKADIGKEGVLEEVANRILEAYVAGGRHGFCIGPGGFVIGPSQNESASIVLHHRTRPDFKITIETHTVREPDNETFSDVTEEERILTSSGGTLTVLHDDQRSLAGLEGHELWISVFARDGDPFLRFTWHYPGTPGDGTRPSVTIVGTASPSQRHELESAWHSILGSWSPLPSSKR